jgi:dual specificity phosphatase 12
MLTLPPPPRRTLATAPFLLPHKPRPPPPSRYSSLSESSPEPCAHIYLAPLSWMRPTLSAGELSGRLECPKCSANVGKYAWQGLRCSCGEWVTPGFQVGRAKVDEVVKKGSGGADGPGMGIRMPPSISIGTPMRKTDESL